MKYTDYRVTYCSKRFKTMFPDFEEFIDGVGNMGGDILAIAQNGLKGFRIYYNNDVDDKKIRVIKYKFELCGLRLLER